MSCSSAWNELQKLTKISFILNWISMVILIIGFASPVWVSGSIPFLIFENGKLIDTQVVKTLGLWQGCSHDYGCLKLINIQQTFGG